MMESALAGEAEFQKAVYDAAIAIIPRFYAFGLQSDCLKLGILPPPESSQMSPRVRLEYFASPDGPVGTQYEISGWEVNVWARRNETRRDRETVFGSDPSGPVSKQSGLVVNIAEKMLEAIARELEGLTWER